MAQYTPNFNLYKPDSTDDFADFRAEHNNNMDIIDQNLGGGGSGGHTIIDENGQSMTQRTGLEFTGNVQVTDDSVNDKTIVDILGGGGNVYGAFINTARPITSGSYSSSFSYTATEDCILCLQIIANANDSATAYIDGVKICAEWSASIHTSPLLIPMKRGQTATATSSNPSTASYDVYGLIQGTNSIFTPIIYSDNERCIGIWRDNKPLYQKTISIGSLPNNAQKDVTHGISDVDIIVDCSGIAYDSTYEVVTIPYANVDSYTYQIQFYVNRTNVSIKTKIDFSSFTGFVTLQYTKTTDSAGSGDWTTDGTPAHHYSTNEQIVGTWIDGKPLYERVFTGLSIALNGNDWVYFNDPTYIENVIDFKAFADYSGRLLNCAITEYQRSNTNGIMFSGISGFNQTVNIIVARFTKTTD